MFRADNALSDELKKIEISTELEKIKEEEAQEEKRKVAREKLKADLEKKAASLQSTSQVATKPENSSNVTLQNLAQKIINNPNQVLREACRNGNIELVKELLNRNNINVSEYTGEGRAPKNVRDSKEWNDNLFAGDAIHNAICGDHPEILMLLMEHIANQLQLQLMQSDERHSSDGRSFASFDAKILQSHIAGIRYFERNRYEFKKRGIDLPQALQQRSASLLIEAIFSNSEKCAAMLINQFSKAQYQRVAYSYADNGETFLDRLKDHYMDGNTLFVQVHHTKTKCTVDFGHYYDCQSIKLTDKEAAVVVSLLPNKNEYHGYDKYRQSTILSHDADVINKIANLAHCVFHGQLMQYSVTYDSGSSSDIRVRGDALSLAIDLGCTKIAKYLIESGVSLEEKYGNRIETKYGFGMWSSSYQEWDNERDLTPLLVAAKKNNIEIVKLLIEKGADLNAKDRDNKSAAEMTESDEIRALLSNNLSLTERIAALNLTLPDEFICPLSKSVFEDPIRINGIAYERSAYIALNKQRPDNKKIDPTGKSIDKKTYNDYIRSETDEAFLSDITEYINQQEKRYTPKMQ